MLKKILIYCIAAVAAGYLIFALLFLTKSEEETVCKGLKIEIIDGSSGVMSAAVVEDILNQKGINPKGKLLNTVCLADIENCIGELSVVDECQSYKTHKNYVGINIHCKIPVMQVFDISGREFYIDKRGDIIDGAHNTLYLPVASGFITRDMAAEELLTIANFLQNNRFWNEQIEQVFFNSKKEIMFVPRIGNHTIEVGRADNLERKLGKLKKFYKKGLNTLGWNKYEKINIEFDKQVICTKRDKKQ